MACNRYCQFNRFNALITKEFYQIVRDPSTFLISAVLPLILLIIYGYGVSLDIEHLKIGIVVEDTSPLVQSFTKSLVDSPYFDADVGRSRNEMEEKLMRGTIRGMVIIPSYFTEFFEKKQALAPIQVIADGSETNTASFVQNYVQGAWSSWLQQEEIPGVSLIRTDTRFWYNPELISRNFLIPGSLAIIMTLIGTLLTALVVAREWERGTMEALMSTPVTIGEIIISKLVAYFLLGMASLVMAVLVALLVYDIPLRGSLYLLVFVSALFLFAALGLGLLLSTLSKSQVVAAQASLVIGFLPAFMLSGFIFEISSMPPIIQMLTYFLPARYFVSCLQTLFLAGDVWSLLIKEMIPMFIIGCIFFYLTARQTVKRLD